MAVGSSVLSMIHEALALSLWRGPLCVPAEPYCGPYEIKPPPSASTQFYENSFGKIDFSENWMHVRRVKEAYEAGVVVSGDG